MLSDCGYAPLQSQYEEIREAPIEQSMKTRIAENLGDGWTLDLFDDRALKTLSEVAVVLEEVVGLACSSPDDDEDSPSAHGMSQCLEILLYLAKNEALLRPADIISDVNGDIRIAWRWKQREVELVSPSDEREKPFIYFSFGKDYGADPDVSHAGMTRKLREMFCA